MIVKRRYDYPHFTNEEELRLAKIRKRSKCRAKTEADTSDLKCPPLPEKMPHWVWH